MAAPRMIAADRAVSVLKLEADNYSHVMFTRRMQVHRANVRRSRSPCVCSEPPACKGLLQATSRPCGADACVMTAHL